MKTTENAVSEVTYVTKGKAREIYAVLKDLTFEDVPETKVTTALLLIAKLTTIAEDMDAKVKAISSKKPKELELTKEDVARLKKEEDQLIFSIAKSNWEESFGQAITALFDEPSSISTEECRIFTQSEFETFLKGNKKKLSMQASVVLINHLVQK